MEREQAVVVVEVVCVVWEAHAAPSFVPTRPMCVWEGDLSRAKSSLNQTHKRGSHFYASPPLNALPPTMAFSDSDNEDPFAGFNSDDDADMLAGGRVATRRTASKKAPASKKAAPKKRKASGPKKPMSKAQKKALVMKRAVGARLLDKVVVPEDMSPEAVAKAMSSARRAARNAFVRKLAQDNVPSIPNIWQYAVAQARKSLPESERKKFASKVLIKRAQELVHTKAHENAYAAFYRNAVARANAAKAKQVKALGGRSGAKLEDVIKQKVLVTPSSKKRVLEAYKEQQELRPTAKKCRSMVTEAVKEVRDQYKARITKMRERMAAKRAADAAKKKAQKAKRAAAAAKKKKTAAKKKKTAAKKKKAAPKKKAASRKKK